MLVDHQHDHEVGAGLKKLVFINGNHYFNSRSNIVDQRKKDKITKSYIKRLNSLGYTVTRHEAA